MSPARKFQTYKSELIKTNTTRRTLLAGLALLAGSAVFAQDFTGPPPGGGGGIDKSFDDELQAMISTVLPKFQQYEYTDEETGLTVPYNLFVPESAAGQALPMVTFIADSSVVGKEVTAPLTQGWGGLIWATDESQAKNPAIVFVPEFASVILDDHDGYSSSDYLAMTARMIRAVAEQQGADMNRLYATGQSMGCMALMAISASEPDLFAAQMFVSGQWDVQTLLPLGTQRFFYIVAEGDPRASVGQQELATFFTENDVPYASATWDAIGTQEQQSAAVTDQLAQGQAINFAMFELGAVMPEGVTANGGAGEHMYSFDPAYKVVAVRDWLFTQSK